MNLCNSDFLVVATLPSCNPQKKICVEKMARRGLIDGFYLPNLTHEATIEKTHRRRCSLMPTERKHMPRNKKKDPCGFLLFSVFHFRRCIVQRSVNMIWLVVQEHTIVIIRDYRLHLAHYNSPTCLCLWIHPWATTTKNFLMLTSHEWKPPVLVVLLQSFSQSSPQHSHYFLGMCVCSLVSSGGTEEEEEENRK